MNYRSKRLVSLLTKTVWIIISFFFFWWSNFEFLMKISDIYTQTVSAMIEKIFRRLVMLVRFSCILNSQAHRAIRQFDWPTDADFPLGVVRNRRTRESVGISIYNSQCFPRSCTCKSILKIHTRFRNSISKRTMLLQYSNIQISKCILWCILELWPESRRPSIRWSWLQATGMN